MFAMPDELQPITGLQPSLGSEGPPVALGNSLQKVSCGYAEILQKKQKMAQNPESFRVFWQVSCNEQTHLPPDSGTKTWLICSEDRSPRSQSSHQGLCEDPQAPERKIPGIVCALPGCTWGVHFPVYQRFFHRQPQAQPLDQHTRNLHLTRRSYSYAIGSLN